ncbi:hypothetical protein QJS04_geneDACA023467 [Acorus gramineus]|uniref:Uncharacterized protein n=1 Tax=Acorus gramineus TaxID=55184 RepID=A0AAV9BUT2_ACOGR|nr:hypothetical protein QJS04_geneDACA023467 [Acorus gramineus]
MRLIGFLSRDLEIDSGYPTEGYPQQAYVAPPPAGYPMKDSEAYPQQAAPVETKSRGDGFWKGWIPK